MSRLQKTLLLLFFVFFGGVFFIISLPRESETSFSDQAVHSGGEVEEGELGEGDGAIGVRKGADDEALLDPGYYTLFSLNVHDWTHPEESIAAVARVLDIHEKYGVPVDIYFTDPLFRLTFAEDPELIDRLRSSTVATVAYHIRPPVPYYPGFDWLGLASMSNDDLHDVLYGYETHALDLTTGKYTDEPGGYAYVKEVMGYAPPGVGVVPGGSVGDVLANVYAELGATFVVSHAITPAFGESDGKTGLFYRPEDVDVKIYEQAKKTQDGGAIVESYLQQGVLTEPYFLGIKYHDDNFFSFGGTPWWSVYYSSDENDKQGNERTPRIPPFPLDEVNTDGRRLETEAEQAQDWALYESTVSYIAEHSEEITSLNLNMLKELLQK